MKKALLALLLLAAMPLSAASWTVVTSTAQDGRFQRDITKRNTATCAAYKLAPNCTQTQARNAFCAVLGSSSQTPPCTLLDGRVSGDVYVYSDIGVYLDKFVIDAYHRDLKVAQQAEDVAAWAAWLTSASQAQKDAVCAAAGLSAGCLP